MKRFLLIAVNAVLLGSLALADVPNNAPDAAEQARNLHRNRDLVEILVNGGLQLAGSDNAMQRADYCNDMVEKLSVEIGKAADSRDGVRAAELGVHVRDLLKEGVAVNLTTAGEHIPPTSPGNGELVRLGDRVKKAINPVEVQLQNALNSDAREDIQRALKAITEGRSAVDQCLQNRGPLRRDAEK